jgi:hypothetical protein
MLAYGQVVDACNNIARLEKIPHVNVSSAFMKAIREVFKPEFLKQST